MENARERSSEREALSSSQDVFIREISSSDNPAASPDDSAKQKEKKPHPPPRSSIVPASHHRSSHPVDRHGQSSSTSGALDLQSLVGRSGSSSSLSAISVPIRLDALSYLLNNAVLGAYKTPSQMPSYPPMYPYCPFPQMGYPYSPCMGSPPYNMPYMNPPCQPGLMPCGTQQGSVQVCQNPMPNFNQFVMGATPSQNQSLFSGITPQSGTPFTTSTMNMTPPGQDNRGISQSNTFAQKANEGFGNKGNPFSSNNEKQSSPPQRGFPRFGDKPSEENWSNRAQNSSNRGFGRGRGDFGGRSWQSNFGGQERRFGERSWNSDSGGRRRFQESPDQSQDRGGPFKRGRWQDGRGRGGDNRDSWQQRNRQSFSPSQVIAGSFQDRFKSRDEEEKVVTKTDDSNDKDEDWEMDYVGEPAACETSSTSLPLTSKTGESPETFQTTDKSVNPDEDVSGGGSTTNLEKEEEELDSDGTNRETTEIEAQEQDKDQAPGPEDESAEKSGEDGEERRKEAEDEEDKEILVSVDVEDH